MTFKNALILGGAILLVAGCSSSVTAPIGKVQGGAASSTRTGTPTPLGPRMSGAATSAAASDSTSCRSGYNVTSGFVDTTCVIEQQ